MLDGEDNDNDNDTRSDDNKHILMILLMNGDNFDDNNWRQ